MSCGCSKKAKASAPHFEEGISYEYCDFEDSGILGGQFYPKQQVHPFVIPADETRQFSTLSDVVQTMYITVLSGVCSFWFLEEGGSPRPTGEQAHMEFTSDQGCREVVLPPGLHWMAAGAGNSAACTVSIVILEREARK